MISSGVVENDDDNDDDDDDELSFLFGDGDEKLVLLCIVSRERIVHSLVNNVNDIGGMLL